MCLKWPSFVGIVVISHPVLGLIETQVDELRAELENQHKRLDEAFAW